ERADQVGEGAVVDAASALCGSDRKADREMRFPDARRAEKDHILLPLHEAELVQAFDLLAANRRLEREVEIAEHLHGGQPARAHCRLEPAVIPPLGLCCQHRLDRFWCRECAALDAVPDGIECFMRTGHLQVRENVAEAITTRWCGAFHTPRPARRAYAVSGRFSTSTSVRGRVRGFLMLTSSSRMSEWYGREAVGWRRSRSSRSKRIVGRSRVVRCTRTFATRSSQRPR